MEMIYLDNSATTALSEISIERLKEGYEKFGNPSSLHSAGLEAEKLIRCARGELLSALGIRDSSEYTAIFTSSGTESDNLAILGTLRAKNFRFTPRIITSEGEHAAVKMSLEQAKKEGAEIVTLKTTGGTIDRDELASLVNERTVLVSIMTVNNETGALYDIKNLFSLVKRINPQTITHTDCVQGFLKIPFSMPLSGADMLTVSGHKIHAPKGVGALVVKNSIIKSKRIVPIIHGGGQEGNLRSGTENVAGIYALGGAAKEGSASVSAFYEKAARLREIFINTLGDTARINTPKEYAPHIISVTLPSIRSETMLHYLSSKGVYISSGSACSSNSGHKSTTLLSFGLSPKEADSTIRVSLSEYTTESEVIFAANAIKDGCGSLARA
jgi:cysteine desulfurase